MSTHIYGKHAVEALLKQYPHQAKKLWFSLDSLPPQIAALVDSPSGSGSSLAKEKIFSKDLTRKFGIKDFESHQGLLLELKDDLESFLKIGLEELIVESSFNDKPLLWLPTIQDAHNLGAVIRSVVASGQIGGLVIPSRGSVPINRVVAKVSAGALFFTKFAYSSSFKSTATTFKNSGIKIITLEKTAKSLSLTDINFDDWNPFVLVVGAEEDGVPRIVSEMADCNVQIPQSNDIDSLNLSVATGITLYEILRQSIVKSK
ncbi:MAG: RNA methyltransferase [Candidatus Caenarcaniphilales bacterium]|nr:RNA methyltransferase [Candidatus Caenarcaniphilales bacterium]